MALSLSYAYQQWHYRKVFRIARGARETSELFVVHLNDGEHIGRGESGVLSQYGETPDTVRAQLESMRGYLEGNPGPEQFSAEFASGSARNAVDCALWDLACKRSGRSIWELTGVKPVPRLETDCTIGIDEVPRMRADAARLAAEGYRVLKVKAYAEGVLETVGAIAAAAPEARLIVDANEAWTLEQLQAVTPALTGFNVALIEQPLHRREDHLLQGYKSPIPLYADESCATSADLERLRSRYDGVNIKLDKSGGLSEALALARGARERGMGVMVGCGGGTSLGLAPAYVIGALCDFRDLDSAALLHEDRVGAMPYRNGELLCFGPQLWG